MLQDKKYQQWWSKEFDFRYLCLHSFDFFFFFRYFILEMFKLNRVEKNSPNTELSYLNVIVILITYIFFNFLLQSLRFLALSLDLVLDCFHFISVHVKVNIWVTLMTQWRPSLAKYKRTVETGFHFLVLEFLFWASQFFHHSPNWTNFFCYKFWDNIHANWLQFWPSYLPWKLSHSKPQIQTSVEWLFSQTAAH